MKKKTGLAEKGKAWRIATYVLLLFMILIAVFPAIWMLSTAIKSPVELYDMPPEIIPDEPTLGNFVSVLQNSKMYRAFFNLSLIHISYCLHGEQIDEDSKTQSVWVRRKALCPEKLRCLICQSTRSSDSSFDS